MTSDLSAKRAKVTNPTSEPKVPKSGTSKVKATSNNEIQILGQVAMRLSRKASKVKCYIFKLKASVVSESDFFEISKSAQLVIRFTLSKKGKKELFFMHRKKSVVC